MGRRRAGVSLLVIGGAVAPAIGADRPVDCIVSSADFNGDGVVDMRDASVLVAHLGGTEHGAWCASVPERRHHIGQHVGDANRDGVVGVSDAAILARDFGGPPDPPIPPIPGVNVRSRCDGGLKVIDTYGVQEYVLIDSNTVPQGKGLIWWDYSRPATGLEPAFSIRSRPDGFDLIAEYHNEGKTARTHGTIRIGGFNFVGGEGRERKFGLSGRAGDLATEATHTFYPSGGMYSPTYLVRGRVAERYDKSTTREYLIGISVQYPLLAYRHGVDFWMKRGPEGTYGLDLAFNTDNDSAQVLDNHPEGDIPPGARRTYTISVRIMAPDGFGPSGDGAEDCLYLFQEYRRYFKRLYGDVRYARDPRPVNGYALAGLAGATPANIGFNPPQLNLATPTIGPNNSTRFSEREAGWNAWIARFENAEARGFRRFMLWAPTGVALNPACAKGVVNYPFQFTSRWRDIAGGDPSNPILATQRDLRRWAMANDREVGLWWGNSIRPAPWGTCDSATVPTLDLCAERDVGAADVEMGSAATETGPYVIGASAIGLDAYVLLQPDIAYVWMMRLRDRNPTVRFITEPACFDVMHTLAPAFIGAYQQNGNGPVECRISGPHVMADFLNKGHETWAHIFQMPDSPECEGGRWHGQSVQERLKQLAAELAQWGFVPVIAGGPPWEDGPYGPGAARWVKDPLGPNLADQRDEYMDVSFEGAASWEMTVPGPLQD